MSKLILVINCGSSSLKYQLIRLEDSEVLAKGTVANIGLASSSIKHSAVGRGSVKTECPIPTHADGIRLMIERLTGAETGCISSMNEISAVGHRVLHGGAKLTRSMLVTPEVKDTIRDCIKLGPLHNPANLLGIETCEEMMPGIPQVAVFDTAFHQTMPAKAYRYGIPKEYYEKFAIRRYGFHGTSHRYVSKRACDVLGIPQEGTKMIVCHLGNGSSLSAVKDGKCVDTSMGLTPLEGLLMGTRAGSMDPAVVSTLAEELKLSAKDVVDRVLNKESGLLGITGKTPDMAEVNRLADEENDPDAILAREMLVYGIQKYIGSYTAAMNGLDVLVFTAGIGENSQPVRRLVCRGMEFFGIRIDEKLNESILPGSGFEGVISAPDSRVKVLVVPTNEELMIAMDTAEIVGL